MHILFFTYDVPYPPNSGGKTRALNLLKYAKKDAKISLFSFTREGYDLSYLDELKQIGISRIELFPRKKVKDIRNIRSLLSSTHSIFHSLYFNPDTYKTLLSYLKEEKVDVVHAESFYTGFYLSDEIRTLGITQVYGSENVEYKLYSDMLPTYSPLLRPLFRREVSKIEKEEVHMANTADAVLAVTEDEANYFHSITNKPIHVIANGVEPKDFPPVSEQEHGKLRLLFIGNFTYFPNVDGMKFFCQYVWPKLDQSKFHLTVVGKNVSRISFLPQNIETIEYVPDIYDAYASADVFISPIRIGGGTNFKVLEAMAAGLPVVALRERATSLKGERKVHLFTPKDEKEFIDSLEELEKDSQLRKRIGQNARSLVEKEYAWDIIGAKLHTIWKSLSDEKN